MVQTLDTIYNTSDFISVNVSPATLVVSGASGRPEADQVLTEEKINRTPISFVSNESDVSTCEGGSSFVKAYM